MAIRNMQWMSEKQALRLVYNKPCRICGQPSCCAVRDNGVAPACMTHGIMAQKLGYIVAFPDPPIMLKEGIKP
jgi:hypothetical protein